MERTKISRPRVRAASERGFTLIETLVAAVVLVVGLLGAFTFLDTSVAVSRATLAREGATTLAREITEDARSLPFSQLSNSTIVIQLQAMPGLANASTGSSWQILRRGVTYTVNASVCAVDSSKDGYGVHSSNINWCSDSSSTGTADPQPLDLQRVNADVTYTAMGSTHDVHEVATIGSSGQAIGLATSGLQLSSPTLPYTGVSGTVYQPKVTSTSVTQLGFSVTAPAGTTAIIWTVNGVTQPWTSTSSGTTWTSSLWNISSLSDGTYQVGAAAENANGVIGPAVTIPLQLIRSIPAAPSVFNYGYNPNLYVAGVKTTVAELQWQPNTELNVTGYKIYNPSGTVICTTTNALTNSYCGPSGPSGAPTAVWCSSATACVDLSPPPANQSSPPLTYQVRALYYDANGALQQGPATSVTMQGMPSKTFSLAPSTGNTGTNCPGSTARDMLASYTSGSSDSTQQGGQIMFCSDAFSAGQVIQGGGTATAYLANPNNSSCTVTATLGINGVQVPSASNTLPASSAVTKYTFNFTWNSTLTMNAGDRLTLSYALSGSGCGGSNQSPTLYYGSTTHPGQLQTTPLPISAPSAPGSLSLTSNSDGSATLTWSAPSGSTPVNFYRIYRGGTNVTNRYDTSTTVECSSGSCTWSDGRRPSRPYSYYVTAVGGTTAGSNMAESAATGPVTG